MLAVADLRSIDATRIGSARFLPPSAEAALVVAPIVGEAIALGAFQRVRSTIDMKLLEGSGISLVRRRAGGPALRVGRGQVYVSLELRAPESLGGVRDPERALNRHVRPFLRALTSLGEITATSGGRDVILARNEPVGWIGVAHERATRRTAIEAVIAVRKGFAVDPAMDLASGAVDRKPPRTLEEIHGKAIADGDVVDAILRELGAMAGSVERFESPRLAASRVNPDEPAFTAMVVESIGLIGAVIEGRSLTIGGDLMASEDSLRKLGSLLFELEDTSDAAVDAAISAA
ncbi:MAG: lipoyl protein ligase domain-containing protein, partial [Polyangiales bacterium]